MIKLYKDGRNYCIGIHNVRDEAEFIQQFSDAFYETLEAGDAPRETKMLQGFLPHAADIICSFRGITKGTGNVRKVVEIIAGDMPEGAPIHTHMSEADEEAATSPDPPENDK